MHPRDHIADVIKKSVKNIVGVSMDIDVTPAPQGTDADYASNISLRLIKQSIYKTPIELAETIKQDIQKHDDSCIDSVSVATPGFLNFKLKSACFGKYLHSLLTGEENLAMSGKMKNKRYLVEYAHPNTHKEMHIGHMRTLITGEAISRLLESQKGHVFRANYQGDIGPHVAKALFGIEKLLRERNLRLSEVDSWNNLKKAELLGEAYVRGNQAYEAEKEKIDQLNEDLYRKSANVSEVYRMTRKWSLDYYEDFYKRFGTKFDRLFFESEMVACGMEIVRKNIGKVFIEDNGAVIFPGEKHALPAGRQGLHTRVFITKNGNPTYEGKEMCNGIKEYEAFPFDQKIHVVGSEQAGYFQVVFKALELIDPDKFAAKQHHVSMGMVQLTDPSAGHSTLSSESKSSGQSRKMSSRTGEILRVDWLLDQIKVRVEALMQKSEIDTSEKDQIVEQIVIGAVKYSVLKVGTGQDVAFDIEKSVSLDGDSGPYLQYTYARTQSVLRKSEIRNPKFEFNHQFQPEEKQLLRLLIRFPEVIAEAAENLSPNILCTYLFQLAQSFNLFYQKLPILKADEKKRDFRLTLTAGVGKTIKDGLDLLGIQAPKRM